MRYFHTERVVFAIPMHYTTDNAIDIQQEAKEFANHVNVELKDVIVQKITQSSRYQHMTCYSTHNTNSIPEDSFKLGDQWTMEKWIEY